MAVLEDFELRTSPGIWSWYERSARQLAFRAQGRAEAEAWQAELRETLTRLLGGRPDAPPSLDAHTLETVEEEAYKRELVVIRTPYGDYMPCYVLVPHAVAAPYRPIIALHGHGTWGARGIVGIADSPLEAKLNQDLNYDYARQFALRGHIVFAPVLRGFGERMESREPAPGEGDAALWLSSCRELSFNALLCGKTLLGMRVWDVIRLIDYIRSRPEPMTDTLGCAGLSGGGMATLFTTALEPRITCAVVSGYVNTFRQSIMSLDHCHCNYVPGILQYAEISDLAGLVAPRPLLVEGGTNDPIFPIAGTRQALIELRRIYACFGAEDALDEDIFEGVHQWSGQKAYAWMERWL